MTARARLRRHARQTRASGQNICFGFTAYIFYHLHYRQNLYNLTFLLNAC